MPKLSKFRNDASKKIKLNIETFRSNIPVHINEIKILLNSHPLISGDPDGDWDMPRSGTEELIDAELRRQIVDEVVIQTQIIEERKAAIEKIYVKLDNSLRKMLKL